MAEDGEDSFSKPVEGVRYDRLTVKPVLGHFFGKGRAALERFVHGQILCRNRKSKQLPSKTGHVHLEISHFTDKKRQTRRKRRIS